MQHDFSIETIGANMLRKGNGCPGPHRSSVRGVMPSYLQLSLELGSLLTHMGTTLFNALSSMTLAKRSQFLS